MDRQKTIRTILIASLILHCIYIVISILRLAGQSMILKAPMAVSFEEIGFIFPYEYIGSFVNFIAHLTLTLIILEKMKDVYNTRAPEVAGIVIYCLSFTFITMAISVLQIRLGNYSISKTLAISQINQAVGRFDIFLRVSITLFITACGMSWYRKTTLREFRGEIIE